MFAIRQETPLDIPAREALLDRCFGPARFAKTCERLREGRLAAETLSFVISRAGVLVGTLRLWQIAAGPGRPALLLGPVAVEPALQGLGLGSKLIRHALAAAGEAGHTAVLLVGDAAYYERFGFSAAVTRDLWLPGPFERERLLGLALRSEGLAGAKGLVSATGDKAPLPELAELIRAANDGPLARAA